MIKEIKGRMHITKDGRYGEFETPTEDGRMCLFMLDTSEYEYFKPDDIEDVEVI